MKNSMKYIIITLVVIIGGLFVLNGCWPDIKQAVFDAVNGY